MPLVAYAFSNSRKYLPVCERLRVQKDQGPVEILVSRCRQARQYMGRPPIDFLLTAKRDAKAARQQFYELALTG